ncbi:MAG: putative lipid II flippase FtsW [Actinomycetes bacterium]
MTASTSARANASRAERRTRAGLLSRPLASYYLVLGTTAMLVMLGLVMVLSASSVIAYSRSGSSFSIVSKQAIWVGIGLPAMFVASRISPRGWRMLGYPLLVLSLLLLVAVMVPGVGRSSHGATRWIDLPAGLQVQPSEPAKLALVLWGADLLARKEKLLGDWKHVVIPLVPGTLVMILLVMLEPDLGTTAVLVAVLLALLWVSGASARVFAALGLSFAFGAGLLALSAPYRLARLVSFRDPFAHAAGTGYQAVHGIYALASGGWWGVGLGASREKWAYLPNAYTDYIYAIIGEELGLIGTLSVLALFALLGYAGIRVASRSRDRFTQLAAAGVTAWLVCQALVNIGYVIGLLPVTGIPLPLVSFGGSALVPTLIALGMLLSFARREPGAPAALARRGAPLRRLARALHLRPVTRRTAGPARSRVPLRVIGGGRAAGRASSGGAGRRPSRARAAR